MTTYSTIADSEIDPESPGTTTLFTKLRNNPLAIQEGDASAPKIVYAALDISASIQPSDVVSAVAGNKYAGGHLSEIKETGIISTYTKYFEFAVPRNGEYRVAFELANFSGGGGEVTYAKVYRNGSPVGSEKSEFDVSYAQKTEDISGWSAGDLLQIYIRNTNDPADDWGIKNVYIKESDPFSTMSKIMP